MKISSISCFKSNCFRIILSAGIISSLFLNVSYAQSVQIQERAEIHPSIVNMEASSEQQFRVFLKATRLNPAKSLKKGVIWSVNNIEGGNSKYGTINTDGIYRAPEKMPNPREIHISGYTEEAQNRILYATVIFGNSPLHYKSVKIWSKPLNDPKLKIVKPHGFGLDKDGNILIADQEANRVFRFNINGEFLNEIGDGPGNNPGQFKKPREIKSNSIGNIYVTDNKGDQPRIQVFSNQGELLQVFGDKGRGQGQLLRAHGIGFGPNKTLFITDVDNMRVNVYDLTGKFLYDFSTWNAYKGMNPNEMNAPHGMFVDKNGDAFVNSYYGPTHKFTPEGAILATFAEGDPDGSLYFHNVTGDKWGNVYVMARPKDGAQNVRIKNSGKKNISVIKFNNNGDFITEWSYSDPNHEETTAAIDKNGIYRTMYLTDKEMIIESFVQE